MPAKHAKGRERDAGDDAPRRKWTIRRAGGARPNREHAAGQYRPACVAVDKVAQESRANPLTDAAEYGIIMGKQGLCALRPQSAVLFGCGWDSPMANPDIGREGCRCYPPLPLSPPLVSCPAGTSAVLSRHSGFPSCHLDSLSVIPSATLQGLRFARNDRCLGILAEPFRRRDMGSRSSVLFSPNVHLPSGSGLVEKRRPDHEMQR